MHTTNSKASYRCNTIIELSTTGAIDRIDTPLMERICEIFPELFDRSVLHVPVLSSRNATTICFVADELNPNVTIGRCIDILECVLGKNIQHIVLNTSCKVNGRDHKFWNIEPLRKRCMDGKYTTWDIVFK